MVIKDNYNDYLNGKEVEATVVSDKALVEKGMHVMGFHNSIAVNTGITVPKDKQAHYIGVEGMVTGVDNTLLDYHQHTLVRVIKI